jgi:hypothetical protein
MYGEFIPKVNKSIALMHTISFVSFFLPKYTVLANPQPNTDLTLKLYFFDN